MNKLKIIPSIILTTLLATGSVLAWVNLGTVNNSDPLTATLWNALVGKINENGQKLDGIYNVSGNIGVGTASPNTKLDVAGTINGSFEGFSYYSTGLSKSAGWEKITVPTLDYNTFGGSTYSNGTFTAPKNGYYNFRAYGYISTAGNNERYAYGIAKNGTLISFAGGNYSIQDTPATTYSHNIYLATGDIVELQSYSAINANFGVGGSHNFWFQGEYLGK